MNLRNVTLVSGSLHTAMTIVNQLKKYLADADLIKVFAIEEGIDETISDELVILSSDLTLQDLIEMNKIDMKCEMIVANRAINFDMLDQIVGLPHGTRVLLVNDMLETSEEVIRSIKNIGLDHLEYTPYYPGISNADNTIKIAITPGEPDKVPEFVDVIYDIGPRVLDFTTVTKILSKLGILDEKAGQFSKGYLEKIIKLAKKLSDSRNEILELNEHLERVIDNLSEGLLVFDSQGTISVSNENFKKIIKSKHHIHINRSLQDVVKDSRLLTYLSDIKQMDSRVFKFDDNEFLVSKFIFNYDTVLVSFKRVSESLKENELIRKELIKKGYIAKYNLDDIIGDSPMINKAKSITKKLAKSDLTILIEGQSGTGKELFASAVHNESKRRKGPYLAVNFSALPDELIESELFGYDEGAFTGAKKGGKSGLFEQADGGTIFLDEIGDVSLKLQARLLRVLQENEIMRVGGSDIKTIDVRVVAATNKNLKKLVAEGKFREDLYYRLKLGFIKLPSLDERKGDIRKLADYFMKVSSVSELTVSEDVYKHLESMSWQGNVRELRNVISYMLAVKENDIITMNDMPMSVDKNDDVANNEVAKTGKSTVTEEELYILSKIKQLNDLGELCGREKLALMTLSGKYEMTKYQMRNRLSKLEEKGFIYKSKGKIGTVLTDEGRDVINTI